MNMKLKSVIQFDNFVHRSKGEIQPTYIHMHICMYIPSQAQKLLTCRGLGTAQSKYRHIHSATSKVWEHTHIHTYRQPPATRHHSYKYIFEVIKNATIAFNVCKNNKQWTRPHLNSPHPTSSLSPAFGLTVQKAMLAIKAVAEAKRSSTQKKVKRRFFLFIFVFFTHNFVITLRYVNYICTMKQCGGVCASKTWQVVREE